MHELSLAEAINDSIKELCEQSVWQRVHRIVIKVGRMRQVDPELLSFAFAVVSKGTLSDGAELSILELPIVFTCGECGQTTNSERTAFVCVNCGSTNVDIISGMELIVDSMEVS